jgi:spore coat assembly protein SafA
MGNDIEGGIEKMRKLFIALSGMLVMIAVLSVSASAAVSHTVVRGESMWKIAVKYQVGLSEIKGANPHIKNPNLIYPGQVLQIPTLDEAVLGYEKEVVRLVNEIRAQNGLKALTYDWELSRVARYKSEDMKENRYFSHTSPVYGSPFQMMRSFGISYRTAGENIAKG